MSELRHELAPQNLLFTEPLRPVADGQQAPELHTRPTVVFGDDALMLIDAAKVAEQSAVRAETRHHTGRIISAPLERDRVIACEDLAGRIGRLGIAFKTNEKPGVEVMELNDREYHLLMMSRNMQQEPLKVAEKKAARQEKRQSRLAKAGRIMLNNILSL